MPFKDQLRPLVMQANAARENVYRDGQAASDAANKAVEQFLRGKILIMSGIARGRVLGSTVQKVRESFEKQLGVVEEVYYYQHSEYGF